MPETERATRRPVRGVVTGREARIAEQRERPQWAGLFLEPPAWSAGDEETTTEAAGYNIDM